MAKASAREAAESTGADILVSFDVDEVLHEGDVSKLRQVAHEMITADNLKIVGTGVFNWFNGLHVKWSEPIPKERMSLSSAGITHGVPKSLRVHSRDNDPDYYHAMPNSDGAGYIWKKDLSTAPVQQMLCDPMKVFERDSKDQADDVQSIVTARTWQDLDRMAESLHNPNHVWIRHYSWWDIPRKWEQKRTWHYLWHHLWGEYPDGLNDYTRDRDTEELTDFWALQPVPVYHIDHYLSGIDDEMNPPKGEMVLRADWVSHPRNDYLPHWLASPNRRVQGRKLATLPKPPGKAKTAWRSFHGKLFRERYQYR